MAPPESVLSPEGGNFLPDLCGIAALFVVVVTGEFVALVMVVAGSGFSTDFIAEFGLLSLYCQWLGLSAAALLCVMRGLLNRLSQGVAVLVSYAMVLAVSYLLAELAWWVVNPVVAAGALIQLERGDLIGRTVTVSALAAALALRYFYVQHRWRQRIASEAFARLEALQARIRPHFFFNCMNSSASLTRSDPRLAERAIEDLAELFRVSMADARAPVPLAYELAFVERYLSIERLRLGERLDVQWSLNQVPHGARLPLLSVQPLVENAIYHGIETRAEGGRIEIHTRSEAGQLVVEVSNPVVDVGGQQRQGNQMALANVRDRLRFHYGAAASVEASSEPDHYRVRLRVPLAE